MYSETRKIEINDCDYMKHVRPEYFFSRFDELATTDASNIGLYTADMRTAYGWIVAKQTLVFHRPIMLDELVTITTVACKPSRVIYPRYYAMTIDDQEVGYCASLWTLIDVKTRRIARVRNSALRQYQAEEMPHEAVTLTAEPCAFVRTYQPSYSDIDTNGHMNNGRYIRIACDLIDIAYYRTHTIKSLSINYKQEVLPEDEMALFMKQEEERFFIKGMKDDDVCFVMEIFFERGDRHD